MSENRTELFRTPLCRLLFAKGLFTTGTYQNDPKATPKYNPTFIFPNKDKKFFEPKLLEVLNKMPDGLKRFKNELIRNPLLAGDGKEAKFKEGEKAGEIKPGLGADVFFIRATAQADKPPAVWWKNPNVQEKSDVVYDGCYGFAILNIYEWKDGKGISFGVTGFQKSHDGERLFDGGGGGSLDKSKWHETIADEGAAPESTKSGAGAGGLFGE